MAGSVQAASGFGRSMWSCALLAGLLAGWCPAQEHVEPGQVAELQSELKQVRQELADMRASQSQQWLDARRAEEVKALVREVLADADTRASLLESSLVAGHRNGNFFLASEDGNYLLQLKGEIQFRHVTNLRDDSGGDDTRAGFEHSRVRLGFSGNVVDPTWTYFIWTGHGPNGSELLLDTWMRKALNDQWSVTFGQFKVPFWREWLVSETRQQAIERSLLSNLFGCNYTQGLMLTYQNEHVRGSVTFNDGVAARSGTWNAEDTDYAFGGRGEWLVFGSWKQFDDQQGWPGSEPSLMLGGAAVYQRGEDGTSAPSTELTRWTLDVSGKWNRLSLLAALLGSHPQTDQEHLDQYGALMQLGWFATDKLELYGRYECGDLDTLVDDTLSIATLGVNYYLKRSQLRLSADIGYAFEPVTAGWLNSSTATGWLADGDDQEGQIVLRSQIQLLF